MLLESQRRILQAKLEDILGVKKVYFQPPSNVTMVYPCIVYHYDGEDSLHADDKKYCIIDKYSLTLISKDPVPDTVLNAVGAIPYSIFNRYYSADNLHHWSFSLTMTKTLERNE